MAAWLGLTRPAKTCWADGREKKPSVRIVVSPSDNAMVETPKNIARSSLGWLSASSDGTGLTYSSGLSGIAGRRLSATFTVTAVAAAVTAVATPVMIPATFNDIP
jgi:hypothetical protein